MSLARSFKIHPVAVFLLFLIGRLFFLCLFTPMLVIDKIVIISLALFRFFTLATFEFYRLKQKELERNLK
jgi:hypothetical protein